MKFDYISISILVISFFLIGLGIINLVNKRPFVMRNTIMPYIMVLALVPLAIASFILGPIPAWPSILNCMLVAYCLIMLFIKSASYSVVGVDTADFRAGIAAALQHLSMPYTADESKIIFPNDNVN